MSQAAASINADSGTLPRAQPIGVSFLAAFALVILIAAGLRFGTNITAKPLTFDEPWIIVPINDLIQQGWSVKTAIDFEETKGPGLIWLYAIASKVVGPTLNDLRLISMICFVLGVLPLLDIARRCGMGGASLVGTAMLYALLPYHAPLSQLVMSEGSFVAFTLAACWTAVVGLSPSGSRQPSFARKAAPIVFGILLSILLHNRVHAVALAGAVTLTAIQTIGWRRALPWIVACTLAGISRIPLWLRWGGLVSPKWQGVLELGFGLDAMAYLLATVAPVVAIFVWAVIARPELRSQWWRLAIAGAGGAALVVIATPDLGAFTPMDDQNVWHFSGIIATAARATGSSPQLQTVFIACVAAASAAGLAALWMMAYASPITTVRGIVNRVQAWLVIVGLGLYALTNAPAYDRYIVGWIVLLPIVWVRDLPRSALIAQTILLLAVAGWLCRTWLM